MIPQSAVRNAARARNLLALFAWLLAITVGLVHAHRYSATPGPSRNVSERWPGDGRCRLAPDRSTLIMFVHPRCPCTRASLQELLVLVSHCPDRFDAQIVLMMPQERDRSWEASDVVRLAADIPGVTLLSDPGGREHQRFRAATSGEVFLYNTEGTLRFHGGITAARGHAGDNAGRLALEEILQGNTAFLAATPVFGCELGWEAGSISNRTLAGETSR